MTAVSGDARAAESWARREGSEQSKNGEKEAETD